MTVKFNRTIAAALLGVALFCAAFSAQADFITNGGFSSSTNGAGQLGYNTNATGWTTSGYNFLFTSGSADTTGVNGMNGNLQLWGPGNGSANGLPASSPDGGNYVGADAAYDVGALTQTINGLTIGAYYTVSFYWAGAQQAGFNGQTTEQWLVSLGSQQLSTSVVTDTSNGFTGWQYTSLTFTASSTSELLSFLASGTPNGEPPFSLLDGVTMVASAPEPATWTLMIFGILCVAAARRWAKFRH